MQHRQKAALVRPRTPTAQLQPMRATDCELWSELARPFGNRTDQPGVTYSPAGAEPRQQVASAIEHLRAWTELALIIDLSTGER